ncbi:hypothetical protein R4572_00735 [Acinetobacter baumannii]|nr:hypothetical protein [Acinetobacter baumannii]HCA5151361.1 hypothetical protein [Acinetobacter baumannii]
MERFGFNTEELTYIQNFNPADKNYWNNTDELMTSIRKKIREHFLSAQGYQCCYCKMTKEEDHGLVWDIEHILPRVLYPQFTFTPLNLAISCRECNRSKWENDIAIDCTQIKQTYISSSRNISIIHPHFDDYHEHIQVIRYGENRLFHTAVDGSSKGRNTFHLCNLMRFLEKAFNPERQFKRELFNHIDAALKETIEENSSPQEMSTIIKTAVNTAIRQY